MVAILEGTAPQVKFPPSHRDFEVHRFLTAEGGSTRAAATRFGISQTRVRQLSQRVVEWAAEVLPPEAEANAAGLLWVAEAAACDRLQHHYEQTMEQWHASHQPKFLGLAVRVTLAAAKLPSRTFAIEAAAADAWEQAKETGDGGRESGVGDREDRGQESVSEEPRPMVAALARPPAGDCSANSELSERDRRGDETERVVSPPQPSKLERLLADEFRPSAEQDSRLRTLLSAPNQRAVAGLGVAAEAIDLSVDDILRRQRRRRAKAK